MNKRIWSFDIGTSSLAYAVRGYHEDENEFSDVQSLLIPDGFASISDAAKRRRMLRTREAHKARESWLEEFFHTIGMSRAILIGRRVARVCPRCRSESVGKECPECSTARTPVHAPWVQVRDGDTKLEREFPAKGDETPYCGCLLRLLLIKGHPLEPWQIYKAFHSAIQKRGYDPDIPWKSQSFHRSAEDDEEGATAERMQAMDEIIGALPVGCRYPCFWEAERLGLWNPKNPNGWEVRITHHARTAKRADRSDPAARDERPETLPAIYPRSLVEAELIAMFGQAEKQYPILLGKRGLLLHGPAEISYASYHANHKARDEQRWHHVRNTVGPLVQGKDSDRKGVLSQKIPTFDNRGPETCRILPHLRVANAAPRVHDGKIVPESLLPAEVTLLMKLKNFRFIDHGRQRGFTVTEVRSIFGSLSTTAAKAFSKAQTAGSYVDQLKLTNSQLSKHLASFTQQTCAFLPDQDRIEAPKSSGRSRYSRPACRIIKALILSGLAPTDFREQLLSSSEFEPLRQLLHLNSGVKYQLVNDHLGFLTASAMGPSWEALYLPNENLAHLSRVSSSTQGVREEAIRRVIGEQLDPIVRHRLGLFHDILKKLENEHGAPDHIVLEFVREDFMGTKAKIELARFQKQRRKERAEARVLAGADNRHALKLQLLKEQGYECIYTARPLPITGIDRYQLEHIVPRELGGPDAYYNFVVTTTETNDQKGRNTPWQWLHADAGWSAYVERVRTRTRPFGFNRKKARLLVSEDAQGIVSRYQTLAETAWIARLARTIACLHFGWQLDFKDDSRRIVTLPGALTNKTARKYNLYSLLGNPDRHAKSTATLNEPSSTEEAVKAEMDLEKKYRSDKRHHALDAMILSFLPQWAADHSKRIHHKLPKRILDRNPLRFFKSVLDDVIPHQVTFAAPALEDKIYGSTIRGSQPVSTLRREIRSIAYAEKDHKLVYDVSILKKKLQKIVSPEIRTTLDTWLSELEPTEVQWLNFVSSFKLPNGTQPKRAVMFGDTLEEFSDLSKDGRGAWRKGDKHRGYFIYLDSKQAAKVRPVYSHQSLELTRKVLTCEGFEIVDFFESNCLVRLSKEIIQGAIQLPPGTYILNSLWADGRCAVTAADGTSYRGIAVARLVQAGLFRIN